MSGYASPARSSKLAEPEQAAPVSRDRDDRLLEALERLEENHQVDLDAVETYERWRVTARDTKGRVMKGFHKPFVAPELPEGKINVSDPDSTGDAHRGHPTTAGLQRPGRGQRQAGDPRGGADQRRRGLRTARTGVRRDDAQPRRAGRDREPEVLLADAGYWHHPQMQAITETGVEVLAPPDGNLREGKRRGWEDGVYQPMRDKLSTDRGRELYAQRKITIEPVFGQIKYNRNIDRFMRRGRSAALSEWRLVTATHNLLKLHSHWTISTA